MPSLLRAKLQYEHKNRLTQNLGNFSEEQGERTFQDLRTMEERYAGRWDSHSG